MLVSNFFVIYFFYPETKNLSLEEVSQLFDGGEVPPSNVDDPMKDEIGKRSVEVTATQTARSDGSSNA